MASKFTLPLRLRDGIVASASVLALCAGAPAFAQDDDTSNDTSVGRTITVTAQFREQALQDTPLAITAVDSALLEARSQDDIKAVAQQAPSVTLREPGGAYGNSMGASIRGIGQFDFNPAYEPGVGMYIDDVYYGSLTGANFDLLDLERVEVLRGPQGTLTGRNSIGGAIKLFSKKPDDENSAYMEASYGTRDRLELRAGANFAITDNLYARISGVHKEQDGFVDQVDYGCANPDNPQGILPTIGSSPDGSSCVVDKLGGTNYSGIRGALRWEASPDIDLMIVGDYQNSDRTSSAETLLVVDSEGSRTLDEFGEPSAYPISTDYLCGKYCTYTSWFLGAAGDAGAYYTGNRNEFSGWGLSGHADIQLSENVQLQSITAYREYNNTWGTDDDFSPDPNVAAGGINDLDYWFFSQELRLNASFGDLADVTVGGYYSDQKSTYWTQQDIRYIPDTPAVQFIGNDPINADTKAAFGTVMLHPTWNLNITGGIRYTEEHKDYTFVRRQFDYSQGPVGLGIEALDGLPAVAESERVDWRISVDYRLNDQLLGYATVSTGFKGGGVTARPFLPTHATKGDFGPETVTAYEVGLKSDLFNRAVRFNVSGFYNVYSDIQLGLSDCTEYGGGPCAVVANAGDGEIWGVEAELFAEPIEGLQIDGSVSLLDSKYTRIDPAVGNSVQMGDPIASPEFQGSIGIQYEADLGDVGSITPRFDLAYRGKEWQGRGLDDKNLDPALEESLHWLDGYALANARITYRNADRDVSVSLEVTNLFDKYYATSRFDAVYGNAGTAYAQLGTPREWRLSVRKEF